MRLTILDNGHTWPQKLVMWLINFSMGHIPGPIKLLTYRKRWFGDPYSACMQEGMRQAKSWKKAELELFAAFVSKLNECTY